MGEAQLIIDAFVEPSLSKDHQKISKAVLESHQQAMINPSKS